MQRLERDFYHRDTVLIAQELIGRLLVHDSAQGLTAGRIVETEAYLGERDTAAHSYRKSPSGRTNIQYGKGGFAYIYLIYGMYNCMNVVTGDEGVPERVLIRALEPVAGAELMSLRRGTERLLDLCSGPGKLCDAMGIDRSLYGADLCGERLYIAEDGMPLPETIATPRINIQYAVADADKPWRFIAKDSPFLSVKPKRSHRKQGV